MVFSQGSGQDGGTLPNAIDVIFNSIEDLQTKKYQLKPDKLNGFEIQNEADAAIDRWRSSWLLLCHSICSVCALLEVAYKSE